MLALAVIVTCGILFLVIGIATTTLIVEDVAYKSQMDRLIAALVLFAIWWMLAVAELSIIVISLSFF
jgi:hypothetical protein